MLIIFQMLFSATIGMTLPPNLSQTRLYKNIIAKEISGDMKSFSPQYPLWSDGALKKRWLFLPENSKIDSSNMDLWNFPFGTIFFKEFSFPKSTGEVKRVETRVMEKQSDGTWLFVSYKWNEDESDATLVGPEGARNVFKLSDRVSHDIPSKTDCLRCHGGGNPLGRIVLGFEALQLSDHRDADAIHGEPLLDGMYSISRLNREDFLTKTPDLMPEILERVPKERQIYGYMKGNCAHCHNPNGSADYTELFLDFRTDTLDPMEQPFIKTALNQITTGFNIPGIQGNTYRIKAGRPDASAILFRMGQRPRLQMPPIATKLVDELAIKALEEYIQGLQ